MLHDLRQVAFRRFNEQVVVIGNGRVISTSGFLHSLNDPFFVNV